MPHADDSTYDGPAREIRLYPDPVLEQPSDPVHRIDDEIRKLAARMAEAMRAAKGIGLAACQMGVPLRLIVLSTSDEKRNALALVNPEIVARGGSSVADEG
jgi:peptide deformylase